jgi:hypothetical protein
MLLTGSQNNSTPWSETVGLQLLAAAFWAGAGALGAVGPFTGALASFAASFVPGMIESWISSGTGPGNANVNVTAAGLLETFLSAKNLMDQGLGNLQNDVEGNWFQAYTYNNQTGYLKDLANSTFPTGGPAYNQLSDSISAQYLTEIWVTILKADYKVTQFAIYNVPSQPDASYYSSYYLKNPAYFLAWADGVLYFRNLGTGVSRYYPLFGGDGGLGPPVCDYLFSTFDRTTVFLTWGIPVAEINTSAPGPLPPANSDSEV